MAAPLFIGDEVSAAGYRLAGAHTVVPGNGEEEAALRQGLAQAPLVIITALVAERIPPKVLADAQSRPIPPLLVVPDLRQRKAPMDLAQLMRAQLGLVE